MSKEFVQKIDWPCHKEILKDFIDDGFDSCVYRYNEFVIKAYKSGAFGSVYEKSQSRLFLYFELTSRASDLVGASGIEITFPFSKHKKVLNVNPVIDSRVCPNCGLIEAISPSISGPMLSLVTKEYDSKELSKVLKDTSRFFEEKLGFKGVDIIPLNIKFLNNNWNVTDLCSNTLDLRRA